MRTKSSKRTPAPEQDRMIVEALRDAGRPVSAYELIDQLREKAVLAPQTVYRSLDRLIANGAAHRLETLNAFVACSHVQHADRRAVFAICEMCSTVEEFEEPKTVETLLQWARKTRFDVREMTLELRGICNRCAEPDAAPRRGGSPL